MVEGKQYTSTCIILAVTTASYILLQKQKQNTKGLQIWDSNRAGRPCWNHLAATAWRAIFEYCICFALSIKGACMQKDAARQVFERGATPEYKNCPPFGF
jgi:hypothetical protein